MQTVTCAAAESNLRRFRRASSCGLWVPERPRRGFYESPYALELASGLDPAIVATLASGGSGTVRPDNITGHILNLYAGASVTTTGSAVTAWANTLGAFDSFTDGSTSARRPTLESDSWNAGTSVPSILFDGTTDYLECTTGLVTSFVGGTDNTYTLAIVAQLVTAPAGFVSLMAGSSSASITQFVDWGKDSDTGPVEKWRVGRVDDTGSNDTRLVGSPDTSRHVFIYVCQGTTLDIYVDGTEILGGSSHSHNVGAITLDRLTIGARSRGATPTVQGFANARIVAADGWSGAVTAAQAKGLNRYYRSKYHVA